MASTSRKWTSSAAQDVCPHLGLKTDPQTCLRYPSQANFCHRANPPDSVRLQHQSQYCQRSQYVECEVFRRKQAGPLPADIRGRPSRRADRQRTWLTLPLAIIVLVGIGGLVWFGEARGALNVPGLQFFRGGGAPSPLPSTAAVIPPSPTPISTLALVFPAVVPTTTPTPTLETAIPPTYFDPSADTPTPVSTAESWCGHELDVPFGPGNKLLIHQLGGGDSLNKFEIVYRTSVAAIEGVNLQFRIPVPVNTVLVIPLDTTEVGSLPVFEPMQVSERNISIQTMAFKAESDLRAFEKYNGFGDRCRDFIGWIVAPRERPAP